MSRVAASVAETSLSETAYFFVHAQAEPGVMPRVLELFAKRGLVPSGYNMAARVQVLRETLNCGISEAR